MVDNILSDKLSPRNTLPLFCAKVSESSKFPMKVIISAIVFFSIQDKYLFKESTRKLDMDDKIR